MSGYGGAISPLLHHPHCVRRKSGEIFHHKETSDDPTEDVKAEKQLRFVPRTTINQLPKHRKHERAKAIRNYLSAEDSGIFGWVYAHFLKGSLFLVIFEMTIYIFVINIIFGWLYWIFGGCCGDEEDLSFWDDFNFSFQTFTTVGYGTLSPEGVSANIIVFFQGIHNLIMTTIFAGVVVTKFIRPRWKFRCSDFIVIRDIFGVPTLEVRVANQDGKTTELKTLTATLTYGRMESRSSGERFYQMTNLQLKQSERHSLSGVWTLQHVIKKGHKGEDDGSPLFGQTFDELKECMAHLHLTITGVDEASGEPVNIIEYYEADDILYGYKFQDQLQFTKGINGAPSIITIDFAKLNAVEPAVVSYPVHRGSRNNKNDCKGQISQQQQQQQPKSQNDDGKTIAEGRSETADAGCSQETTTEQQRLLSPSSHDSSTNGSSGYGSTGRRRKGGGQNYSGSSSS